MFNDNQTPIKTPNLLMKGSSKEKFFRPFIKPIALHHDPNNKENLEVLNNSNLTKPVNNKKQAVFSENPSRKYSINAKENDELLSPGHHPHSSNKMPSFKSPQRQSPSYFNVKGSPKISFNSPQNNIKIIKTKGKNIGFSSKPKENFLDKMKIISEDFVQSTKSFINHKINRLSAREKCACDTGLNKQETCKKAFLWLFKRYQKKDLVYLKNTYENLQKKPLVEESVRNQISRDILRTYPNCVFFIEKHEGCQTLERVLITFASFDPQIGYVQGMNYIAAFFLYHSEEYIAFWLLALIFELFELRDIYLPNLPGLSKHLQIIDMLILAHTPKLYNHLISNCITSEMYCSPWLFSLFGMVIPLEEMAMFYDEFLAKGWTFFYQIILGFLIKETPKLLKEDGMGVLQILTQNNYKFHKPEEYERNRNYWRILLRTVSGESSSKPQINSQLISKLHSNYDQDTRTFKILLNNP